LPCAQFSLRKQVIKTLGQDFDSTYTCCQGYIRFCCWQPGKLGESSCPTCCLCLESFCCHSCAVSSSRMYLMDHRRLQSDPCDRCLICFSNCLQYMACACYIISIFKPECRNSYICIQRIADCVYCMVAACMTAQVNYECKKIDAGEDNVTRNVTTGLPNGPKGQHMGNQDPNYQQNHHQQQNFNQQQQQQQYYNNQQQQQQQGGYNNAGYNNGQQPQYNPNAQYNNQQQPAMYGQQQPQFQQQQFQQQQNAANYNQQQQQQFAQQQQQPVYGQQKGY
jgi:hypothetical protein